MRIAVDAMGGDYAPAEIVKGTVQAARDHDVAVLLVGPPDLINAEMAKHDTGGLDIEIVPTEEYLVEGEHPAYALREKRQASVLLATKLVRDGKADAAVSAGPTGGVVAAALSVLGTVAGITRPVVGGPVLGFAPDMLLFDGGGNVDCRPEQFLDFAVVGCVLARRMQGIKNPTVALLSVGVEEGKGNAQMQAAYPLFKASGLNFIGNVEGYDLVTGKANVVICDGSVGNILIKFMEQFGKRLSDWLDERLGGKVDAAVLADLKAELIAKTNSADAVGGGPLWAVNGIACVAHGRSTAEHITKVIAAAKQAVEQNLVREIEAELLKVRGTLPEPGGRA
jgi:glycerol-3-phosphate acyltransferase PlsX